MEAKTIVITTTQDLDEFFEPMFERFLKKKSTPQSPQRYLDDEILTKKEVLEVLKIKSTTFYDWIRNGKMPAFKLEEKGEWRVKYKDIKEMIK